MKRNPILTLSISLLLGSFTFAPPSRATDVSPGKVKDNSPVEAGDDPRPRNAQLGRAFDYPNKDRDPRAFKGPAPRLSDFEVPLDKVKHIPPAGVMVPDKDRAELEAGVKQLGTEIDALQKDPKAADLLPDVQIYFNAVHYALKYDEFFDKGQIEKAKVLVKEGLERAKELREGKPGWTTATGLVVRGYVSKIDGSVQPYGLVIPETLAADPAKKRRLDLWYHGRGETLNEISFLAEHEKSAGQFTPPDTIVLHPYGRYCNGNRFAGEVDTFEALDNAKKHYAISEYRTLVRGFSMGGGACWMMATHYPDHWAAAAPGAGFSETAEFLHITDLSTIPWYQQKLWALYDSTTMAVNLYNLPVVAYSGELDAQKQAADVMEKAMAAEGMTLAHIIGPGAHHNYVPAAKEEIDRRLNSLATRGKTELPWPIKFATYTLRYNSCDWVTIDQLEHHWEKTRIEAENHLKGRTVVSTVNVAAFTLRIEPGYADHELTAHPAVTIDDQKLDGPPILSDRSWTAHFIKVNGKWEIGAPPENILRKRHNLQGPIDDAFMDSFIMVSPTGKPMNEKTGEWVKHEEAHAIDAWRKQFRGEARVKEDSAVTDADIANSNLVLWGDPSSNAILAKIADKLPIKWDAQAVHVGDKTYPSAGNVPVLIYPNPLNPKHYVVLNSGFTFREYDYENNARQTPKLPDWAIVDITTPPTAQSPGGIPAAGFFGEKWELTEEKH